MGHRVLIVDDDMKFCTLLGRVLTLEGYEAFKAFDIHSALDILKNKNIETVLLDTVLPDGNGTFFTKDIKQMFPSVHVVVLTGKAEISSCIRAIKNGAEDYLVKDGDSTKIVDLLKAQFLLPQVIPFTDNGNIYPAENRGSNLPGFESIIGESAIIRDALKLAERVAATDASVLLLGETGTGKELFAKAIHQNSRRSHGPFITVNCSAFSAELLESELFGYTAGAFTGAVKTKKGLLEEADGGTLFLDEIGEMDKGLQTKLLRVIETHEVIKVGDTKNVHLDIRIVSATNKDLDYEVKNGNFREDLFYRLNVFSILLPPLRDRGKDILLLANFFMKEFSQKEGKRINGMSAEFSALLEAYLWKGNIRELKNVIERSVILSELTVLYEDTLPNEIIYYNPDNGIKGKTRYDLSLFEKQHIQKVLIATHWNKPETARLLNISVSTLYRKIENYMLNPGEEHLDNMESIIQ